MVELVKAQVAYLRAHQQCREGTLSYASVAMASARVQGLVSRYVRRF